jgi:TFIIF-interacting CTD phosphatase-like protein
MIDLIDPKNKYFAHRIYRNHCIETPHGFIKDLSIINNRSIKEIIMLENNIYAAAL